VVEAEESAEAEAEEIEDSSSEDDDVALDDSWQQFAGVDEQQLEDLNEDADAAADSAAAISEDGDVASEQLPQSIVEALQTHNWPSNVRKQQMQQRAEQQSQEGSSEQQPKQHQQRSQQPQQPQQRLEPLRLNETNPMYLPVLTDEDLDNDPPGHQSGYVAVIGRPNAGEQAFQCQVWGVRIGVAASWFARFQL
jgi:GTP-binding protein Era